jgi:hypothetical protein
VSIAANPEIAVEKQSQLVSVGEKKGDDRVAVVVCSNGTKKEQGRGLDANRRSANEDEDLHSYGASRIENSDVKRKREV